MAKETVTKESNQDLEMQLMREKLKNLESQLTKPKTSEEQFQERLARYEANKEKREAQKLEIEKRKMQIWQANPRMRQDEVMLIESWERRIEETKESNPHFASMLKHRIKEKIKEVNEDIFR